MVNIFEPNNSKPFWNKRTPEDIIYSIWFDLTQKKDYGSVERAIRDDYIPYWTKNLNGSPNGIIGNPYWTVEALTKIHRPKRVYKIKDGLPRDEKLQHEHIVPRKFMFDTLLKHCKESYFTKEFVRDIMTFYAIGVTITKKEHNMLPTSEMPPEFFSQAYKDYYYNRWARYRKTPEIEVVHVTWNENRSDYITTPIDYNGSNMIV